jgi:phage repressor protein C with HTH and peptisase S24 domain
MLQRLKIALGIKSDSELAEYLGMPQSTLANQKRRGGYDYELIISKANNVNLHWLFTGEGEMLLSKPQEIDENTTATLPVAEVEFVQVTQEELLHDIEEKLKNLLFQIQTVLHHD